MKINEYLEGRTCYIGLDLSAKHDLTAIVAVFKTPKGFFFKPRMFSPRETIFRMTEEENVPFKKWQEQGHLRQSGFEVIDFDHIYETLNEWEDKYRIRELGHDPWEATEMTQRLSRTKNYEIIEVPQTIKYLAPPTKKLRRLILSGELFHPENPCFTWQINGMTVYRDNNENPRPKKDKSEAKIDGVVALLMGLDRAVRNEGTPDQEKLKTRGIPTV